MKNIDTSNDCYIFCNLLDVVYNREDIIQSAESDDINLINEVLHNTSFKPEHYNLLADLSTDEFKIVVLFSKDCTSEFKTCLIEYLATQDVQFSYFLFTNKLMNLRQSLSNFIQRMQLNFGNIIGIIDDESEITPEEVISYCCV